MSNTETKAGAVAHVCAICKKPRLVEWSGKWTAAERLFLIALITKIQRHESPGRKRTDVTNGWAWEHASSDSDHISAIVSAHASSLHVEFADLVIETVLAFDPDVKFDEWLRAIESRVNE